MYTYHYAQPKEYRFSLDSIRFAKWLAERLQGREDLSTMRVLDLCAGCGVIGFELSWHLPSLRDFSFIEVQEVYTDYFYENVKIIQRPELSLKWHPVNYEVLQSPEWENQFDLIISNPPYFFRNAGVLSPSSFKNRCRFFMDSSFEDFLKGMKNALKPEGEAYFLSRLIEMEAIDRMQMKDTDPLKLEQLGDIRGTAILSLAKSA